MLQSQGLRPLDPYRTLQLHPHAPRDLVVAAYWALVARQKRRLAIWPAAGKLIGDLNAAYGTLMDDEQRRLYDEEHGLTHLRAPHVRVTRKGFGLLGLGTTLTMVSDHADFYHLLRVDREADAEIIELAHAILTRKAAGHDIEDVFLRDLLEEAYHTLRNPQLRAQYDASLASGTAPGVRAPLVAQLPPAALHVVVPEESEQQTPPPAEQAAAPIWAEPEPASAPEAVPEMFSKAAPLDDDAAAEPAVDAAAAGEDGEDAPPPAAADEPDAPGAPDAAGATASGPGRPARSLLHMIGIGPRTNGHAPAHPAPRPDDLRDAEDARFLTLQGEDLRPQVETPPPPAHHVPPHLAAAPAADDATLVFVAGPLTGERVPLGEVAVTIGTSFQSDVMLAPEGVMIAPEHARIWRHGDHFVFRQLDGSGTIIGGEQLTLPLVMLEHGDEIWIGAHRMRFSRNSQ